MTPGSEAQAGWGSSSADLSLEGITSAEVRCFNTACLLQRLVTCQLPTALGSLQAVLLVRQGVQPGSRAPPQRAQTHPPRCGGLTASQTGQMLTAQARSSDQWQSFPLKLAPPQRPSSRAMAGNAGCLATPPRHMHRAPPSKKKAGCRPTPPQQAAWPPHGPSASAESPHRTGWALQESGLDCFLPALVCTWKSVLISMHHLSTKLYAAVQAEGLGLR